MRGGGGAESSRYLYDFYFIILIGNNTLYIYIIGRGIRL